MTENNVNKRNESNNFKNELIFFNNPPPYNIIKKFGVIENGELLLVSLNLYEKGKKLFLLEKIDLLYDNEKNRISQEIKKIAALKLKYLIEIFGYFFEQVNQKEICCIIMEYSEYENLEHIIYKKNILNSKIIWKIFIQLILGIKALSSNNFIIKNYTLKNIFFDRHKNIKLNGFGMISDFIQNYDISLLFNAYLSPEIITGQKRSDKNDIWFIGCILYELVYKQTAFKSEQNIININYETIYDYNDFNEIIFKLLTRYSKRLNLNNILHDIYIKNRIIELGMLLEIIETNIKSKFLINLIFYRFYTIFFHESIII